MDNNIIKLDDYRKDKISPNREESLPKKHIFHDKYFEEEKINLEKMTYVSKISYCYECDCDSFHIIVDGEYWQIGFDEIEEVLKARKFAKNKLLRNRIRKLFTFWKG